MRTIKRDIVGAFIFAKDGRILMGKGSVYDGAWIVPGGGIEPGETHDEALRREIMEETGLDIRNGVVEKLDIALTSQTRKILRDTGEEVKADMRLHNYKVSFDELPEDLPVQAADDFTDATWFTIEELKKLQLAPPSVASLQYLGYTV